MKHYRLLPGIIIRSPLLPVDTCLSPDFGRDNLVEFFKNPVVLEALYLASPVLHEECIKWSDNKIDDKSERNRVEVSLVKYLIRMSCRSTPFGLFAGVTFAAWGSQIDIRIPPAKNYGRHTRLDMFYLCALANKISQHEDVVSLLKFHPNSTIYEFHNVLRYFESRSAGGKLTYEISEVPKTDYLTSILETARKGAKIGDLAQKLISPDVSYDEAAEYINELVKNQLLVSELEPAITGPEFLEQILVILRSITDESRTNSIGEIVTTLESVQSRISEMDNRPIGNSAADYKSIALELEKLQVPIDEKMLFQVDMIKVDEQNTMDSWLAGQIRKGIAILHAICPHRPNANLTKFKEAFIERYENREVPLLQALDNESGIGYGKTHSEADITPLVDNIPIPFTPWPASNAGGNTNRLFHSKYIHAIRNNQYEVEVTDSEISPNKDWSDLPASFSVAGEIISYNKIEKKSLIYLKGAAGSSSAANLLGRFTHVNKSINEFVLSIAKQEQKLAGKTILAEVVHLPQSRMGNILLRTQVREFEIPFLAKASVQDEYQIPLEDLLVSVHNGRIKLRSRKLNTEIIPRLASAHNFTNNAVPLYQFFGDLQSQDFKAGLFFQWDVARIDFPFRPRVRYSNLILSRATWFFDKSEIDILFKNGNDQTLAIKQWRDKWMIPQYISLVRADNELPINLENSLHLRVFKEYIKNKPQILFTELLIDPSNCLLKDHDDNSYSHEFIMGFEKTAEDIPTAGEAPFLRSENGLNKKSRYFTAGSEWLYFKFYLGFKSSETLLTQYVPNLIAELTKRNLIKNWFFIRYLDPQNHIRLRFHLSDKGYTGQVIAEINQFAESLIESSLIHKVQIDTYVREIERYGTETIEVVEEIFGQQSEFVVDFLSKTGEYPNQEPLRLYAAIKYLDDLLGLFGLDVGSKKRFVARALKEYTKEFNINTYGQKHLGQEYKSIQKYIEGILGEGIEQPPNWLEVADLLNGHGDRLASSVIRILGSFKATGDDPYGMIWGIYHLFVNKLMRSKQRKHELLVYFLTTRYYEYIIHKDGAIRDGSSQHNKS